MFRKVTFQNWTVSSVFKGSNMTQHSFHISPELPAIRRGWVEPFGVSRSRVVGLASGERRLTGESESQGVAGRGLKGVAAFPGRRRDADPVRRRQTRDEFRGNWIMHWIIKNNLYRNNRMGVKICLNIFIDDSETSQRD